MSRRGGGAKDQVARLLRLVPWLHAHGGIRLAEAASALDSTPTQVLDDLKVLLMCGLPGGYPDDLIDVDLDALEDETGRSVNAEGVIRVSNADYLARPLRLTPSEATALIVALRAVRDGSSGAAGGAGASTIELVDRTLAKLEAAVADGEPVADRVEVVDPDVGLTATRATIATALAQGRQLELTYYVPSRDEESTRVVDPRALTTVRGIDYLDAYCHSAEAPRVFRLDRIHELRVLDTPLTTEPTDRVDLSRGFFEPSPQTWTATLRLSPRAAWVTEYYPVEQVRTLPDGDLEVDLRVGEPRWLERLLMRLAPDATVVRPQEFTESFLATARRTLTLYPDSDVD